MCHNNFTALYSPIYIYLKSELGNQNSELRILFNIIHEDCNKLVIVTITKSQL